MWCYAGVVLCGGVVMVLCYVVLCYMLLHIFYVFYMSVNLVRELYGTRYQSGSLINVGSGFSLPA